MTRSQYLSGQSLKFPLHTNNQIKCLLKCVTKWINHLWCSFNMGSVAFFSFKILKQSTSRWHLELSACSGSVLSHLWHLLGVRKKCYGTKVTSWTYSMTVSWHIKMEEVFLKPIHHKTIHDFKIYKMSKNTIIFSKIELKQDKWINIKFIININWDCT